MLNITYNKIIKMVFIQEIKGISKYGNDYHFIKLLKIEYIKQVNKVLGKCFDCIPYYGYNIELECGDIVEVIFDKHSTRKNPQIDELSKTGENIFKTIKYDNLILTT